MLLLETALVGREAKYGLLRSQICKYGFSIGGNWDYDKGSFDVALWREGGTTIYLRAPFVVVEGEMDCYDCIIRFQKPFIIKHIVNMGLDYDESSWLDATGASQFQSPVEKDAEICQKSKWMNVGQDVIENQLIPYIH
ncbi:MULTISPECIES: YugN family protein [Bacillales]|uniref:YugN family protein n=1 Tax=Lysinibacillus louembei TaxID=1470088 RepID=A0ABZ0S185_9BACI|nr:MULTISPECIES: YugN family protein [Bacillales]MCT6925261.1 YugN-like family protein [Metasolibacillus sp.]MCT6941509.1 YugN-like family protein [Metasolibacillus sp.]WPK11057.1 YugN family protein [Lysinibacillus louembei]